jgi:hypothetical protein
MRLRLILSVFKPFIAIRRMIWITLILHVVIGISRYQLHPFSETPRDHYSYLTAGLLKGQTHLDFEPAPGLAKLENPYLGFQGVEKLHDASYFNGRYYLYFGITPVLLLFAPWRLVMGTYLPDAYATFTFCTLTFWFLATTWQRIRAHWFKDFSWRWDLAGVLALSAGAFTPYYLQQGAIYFVPITCAGFCGSVALWSVTRLLSGTTWRRLHFFLAGVAWALCMGARPSYLFSFLGLFLLLGWAVFSRDRAARLVARLQEVAAAVLPVLGVGAGLAWYNYARFGSLTEFGIHYQLASSDQRDMVLMSVSNVKDRFVDYFLAAPEILATYPFLVPGTTWGLLYWAPFALLALAAPLVFWLRPRFESANWNWLVLILVPFGFLNLVCVLGVPFANERYSFDFVPFLNLGALITCASLCGRLTGIKRRVLVGSASLLLGISVYAGIVLGLQAAAIETRAPDLVRLLNRPSFWWEKLLGADHGSVVLEVKFPQGAEGRVERLFSTANGKERLEVQYLSGQQVRLAFRHLLLNPIYSNPFVTEPGRSHLIEIDWGSLYPSKDHPFFEGVDDSRIRDLKSRVRIAVDGNVVIERRAKFFPSSRSMMRLAEATEERGAFTGAVRQVSRSVAQALPPPLSPSSGDITLCLRLPRFTSYYSVPLLASGRTGRADLFWITYVSEGKATISHHSLGHGVATSEAFTYHSDETTSIQLRLGGFADSQTGLLEGSQGMQIRVNGEEVMTRRRHVYAARPEEFYFGIDPFDLGLTNIGLDAEVLSIESAPRFDSKEIQVERRAEGPVRLLLQLPEIPGTSREPLLTTGVSGDGDLFFIEYLSAEEVRFGIEVWGYGLITSPPLRLRGGQSYTLDLSLGSLYPALGSAWWGNVSAFDPRHFKDRVLLRVNDALLWEADLPGVRDRNPLVTLSSNDLGFSECAYSFSGKIRLLEVPAVSPFFNARSAAAPFSLRVKFPASPPTGAEPLLISGVTGDADILYVKYLPNDQIVLGMDQWGIGAYESPPISITRSQNHTLTLLLGPLLPPSTDGFWLQPVFAGKEVLREKMWVALDGRIVWRCDSYQPRVRPQSLTFGVNRIQASTCAPEFTGELELSSGPIFLHEAE